MAKKSKQELVEQARELGIEVDEDAPYNELNSLVKGGLLSTTEIPLQEDEKDDEELPWPLDHSDEPEEAVFQPEEDPKPVQSNQPTSSGWNTLGVWVGRKVQRHGS